MGQIKRITKPSAIFYHRGLRRQLPWLDEFRNFLMWEEAGKIGKELSVLSLK
jgi:hypothetical protein